MPSGLIVIHPGLFSTVQDLGRTGFLSVGLPSGGVFDRGSAAMANALLGNCPDAAVVEMTLSGGRYQAVGSLGLAIAGARFKAEIETVEGRMVSLRIPSSFSMRDGESLVIGGGSPGVRAYLAASRGWRTPRVLGSRSGETPLRAGVLLPCDEGWTPVRRPLPAIDPFSTATVSPIRIIEGTESDVLDRSSFHREREFEVTQKCDRMGLRLDGEIVTIRSEANRVSTPVAPGAIQAVGDQILILGRAGGTMGGYPHVAHVISVDLDRIAQAAPRDRIRFEWTSLGEQRRLDREDRRSQAAAMARIATMARDVGLKEA